MGCGPSGFLDSLESSFKRSPDLSIQINIIEPSSIVDVSSARLSPYPFAPSSPTGDGRFLMLPPMLLTPPPQPPTILGDNFSKRPNSGGSQSQQQLFFCPDFGEPIRTQNSVSHVTAFDNQGGDPDGPYATSNGVTE